MYWATAKAVALSLCLWANLSIEKLHKCVPKTSNIAQLYLL